MTLLFQARRSLARYSSTPGNGWPTYADDVTLLHLVYHRKWGPVTEPVNPEGGRRTVKFRPGTFCQIPQGSKNTQHSRQSLLRESAWFETVMLSHGSLALPTVL